MRTCDRLLTVREEIGQRIKRCREEQNLSQQQLADRLFVSRELIAKWESGSREIKGENIVAIAIELNSSCDYLLRGYEPQNLDFCERTGLSNRALENLLKVCEESPDTLDVTGSVEVLINGLLESDSIKSIANAYGKIQWCKDALDEMRSIGVTDTQRELCRDSQIRRIQAYNPTAATDIPLPKDEWVISGKENDLDYAIYTFLETIKKAVKED